MTGPHSGSKRPGEEDSWESLAEDLFGIDFHRGEASNLADDEDDDEEFAPAKPVAPSADEPEELEAGFSEDDEEDAGFPEDEEELSKSSFEEKPPLRKDVAADTTPSRRSGKPAPKAEEGDPFWDALNDWDWEAKSAPRKRPEPAEAAEKEDRTAEEEERTAESPARGEEPPRGRRGRRRGRGGRGRPDAEERETSRPPERTPRDEAEPRSERPRRPAETHREPDADRERRPSPLSKLVDDFDFEPPATAAPADEADDGFGAGLVDEPVRRREQSRPPARREERRERQEEPSARPRNSERGPERAAQPPARPVARAEEDEDEAEGDEERPRRRRRRRRRRSGETADRPEQQAADVPESEFAEAGFPDEEVDEETEEEEPPRRRRERTDRPESVSRAPEPSTSTRQPVYRDVPSWAEAIALLVHRRPKTTSNWSPEPEEPERESGPPSRPRRRRRRPS